MGKEIISLSIDNSDIEDILESCMILGYGDEIAYTEEYEVPYQVEILMSTRKGMSVPDVIEIRGLKQLKDVIDEEDSLPDFGLFDYTNEELDLDLKDKTIREIYKEIFEKIELI
ncbi:hypothetical protein GOQ29_14445 [Clostridium sp. D2Q-14]|uniref:hypothetical protein n=1 Tax=Anaeromonas gelatinilytica TaxID=2683194 RepID=UPI00193B884C|nr:hypothetical protein [Anaeromonas gelatinilytica]MBS4536817.1 hypothetical protein [Anaeromonas gelatinilytica]